MSQDIFCFDIHNQISNEFLFGNSEIFKDNNCLDLSNIKNQSQYSFNNLFLSNSFMNLKNEESEKEKERDIKLNNDIYISNNINNNIFYQNNNFDNSLKINNNFNNNYCIKVSQYIPFNENHKFEELFLNASLNYENNLFNFNEKNNNTYIINKNNKSNLLNNNNNKNDINKNNLDSDNNFYKNEMKEIVNLINEDENENNNKNKDSNFSQNIKIEISNNNKKNIKHKRKIRKKNTNKLSQIIQYGHPKRIIYKTMKQKLNIHKKLDLECRNDTILLIYSISKLKNLLKNIISKEDIKDEIFIQRIQNLYRNSILSLQHREYAQDITGYKLI